jgi:hypothetical protein
LARGTLKSLKQCFLTFEWWNFLQFSKDFVIRIFICCKIQKGSKPLVENVLRHTWPSKFYHKLWQIKGFVFGAHKTLVSQKLRTACGNTGLKPLVELSSQCFKFKKKSSWFFLLWLALECENSRFRRFDVSETNKNLVSMTVYFCLIIIFIWTDKLLSFWAFKLLNPQKY